MRGSILSCFIVILPSQVKLPSNISSSYLAIFPSQVILPFRDVVVVSVVAVVKIRYNKIIVALIRGLYYILCTLDSPCFSRKKEKSSNNVTCLR